MVRYFFGVVCVVLLFLGGCSSVSRPENPSPEEAANQSMQATGQVSEGGVFYPEPSPDMQNQQYEQEATQSNY